MDLGYANEACIGNGNCVGKLALWEARVVSNKGGLPVGAPKTTMAEQFYLPRRPHAFCKSAVTFRAFASIRLSRRASRAFCRWTNRGNLIHDSLAVIVQIVVHCTKKTMSIRAAYSWKMLIEMKQVFLPETFWISPHGSSICSEKSFSWIRKKRNPAEVDWKLYFHYIENRRYLQITLYCILKQNLHYILSW